MSIQFGRWNRRGQPVDPKYLADVSAVTARYPSDGDLAHFQDDVGILYKRFETTREASSALQPLVGPSGVVLTWDGRLDNRPEILAELRMNPTASLSDAEIVLVAYERWTTNCFRKLLGDWAVVLWHPAEKVLLLAKDLAGTRQLYYSIEASHVTWCTVLDPLVLLSKYCLSVSEEYVAGYLSTFPATHLTPYASIHAVPAGACVKIMPQAASRHDYECFAPSNFIRCRTDAEYEEQFRAVFGQAVLRRLRSSYPVIAELSGGMDSTAIVCVADMLLAEGKGETPRLDTISYYDDEEPNWNERPFFSLVEKKRGRAGIHVNFGHAAGTFEPIPEGIFIPLPGGDKESWDRQNALHRHFEAGSYRTLLSGIGGDEFLGGVPTPVPELQDLLRQFRWKTFGRRLLDWSVYRRSPWVNLAAEVSRDFLPRALRRPFETAHCPPWLAKSFASRHAETFWSDTPRLHLAGRLPSFETNLNTLDRLRRQLNCVHLDAVCPYQMSFPYLDRDLLEFLFAIPREQRVRPGQRRSLMRRALAGIVPAEILSRRRKGYVSRRPLVAMNSAFPRIERLFEDSVLAAHGWLDRKVFSATLSAARHGQVEKIVPVLAVLQLEQWLQSSRHIDAIPTSEKNRVQPGRNAPSVAIPSTS
jgi:asparagine synthase (glutamine-hydrolysing)